MIIQYAVLKIKTTSAESERQREKGKGKERLMALPDVVQTDSSSEEKLLPLPPPTQNIFA
jgi:hypothetical protein